MPPRTRTRATKVLKENIEVVKKNKLKSDEKVKKTVRKALADKTNSLSDDNASIDIHSENKKTVLKKKVLKANKDDNVRPRRERRLPPRYIENQVLKNLCNNKDLPVKVNHVLSHVTTPVHSPKNSPLVTEIQIKTTKTNVPAEKNTDSKESPTKALAKVGIKPLKSNKSAIQSDKLAPYTDDPSKYEERPPNKFAKNAAKSPTKEERITASTRPRRNCRLQSAMEKPVSIPSTDSSLNAPTSFKTPSKDLESSLIDNRPKRTLQLPSRLKMKPNTNNNGKNKILRAKRVNVKTKLQTKQVTPEANKITPFAKRLLDKSMSFRILEDNQKNKGDSVKIKGDVYEFTFDPNDEPKPQKKKRKKPVKKRPAKPKVVVLKSNYNENVSKALAHLKSKVKPSQSQAVQNIVKPVKPIATEKTQNIEAFPKPMTNDNIPHSGPAMPLVNESAGNSIHESNYASIRVEDIAADFESNDHHGDINYSPVNSPATARLANTRPATPISPEIHESHINPINTDPLNLQGDLSFFDEIPVASSSMNVSVRHPLASPWRVEFASFPMKWHSNTYVKPNMTPAVESSFIHSEEMAKKKHVYTNMVPVNESLPEIVDNASNLKQTSIISFMREVAERSANKKKRRRSPSPTKANSVFDDVTNTPNDFGYKTPKKARKTAKLSTPNESDNSNDKSNDKENSNQSSNRSVSPAKAQNEDFKKTAKVPTLNISDNSNVKSNDKENSNHSGNKSKSPAKAQKNKDKDGTYFGFDDSESLDQENVSPVKIIPNTRTKGIRARAVLQELNSQARPTRAAMPVSAKAKLTSSEVVEQLYDQLKSAEDAPQFPDEEAAKEPADNTVATNVDDPSWNEEDDDDSQSVHLFEDIEVVHHLKPHRKSYGKSKKVTFMQHSSDRDTHPHVVAHAVHSSDDDLADLMYQMPNVKQKKVVKRKKPKNQLSKKEEKAVEKWAAGFNSMCDDIDDFQLTYY